MLRFPNPSSKIRNFVSVYRVAYQKLSGRVVGIDDIVKAVVDGDLATSSGHVGNEAIARSTRTDRSRDPLYNQIKMYTELFRSLGWLHRTSQAASLYTFTSLGGQVVEAENYYAQIVGESALGIAYPSHALDGQRGNYNTRPFCFLLRVMLECEGLLSRDEMIVGPLSAQTDRTPTALEEVAAHVLATRSSASRMATALSAVADARSVRIDTLRNYTRWPIALMRDIGWTEKRRATRKRRGGPHYSYALTTTGIEAARDAAASVDLRADEVSALSRDKLRALSLFAHYRMLERSGFDVSSVGHFLDRHEATLSSAMDALSVRTRSDILFSPFQSLPVSDIERIFGPQQDRREQSSRAMPATDDSEGHARDHQIFYLRFSSKNQSWSVGESVSEELTVELTRAYDGSSSTDEAAEQFVLWHSDDTKAQFYPLVRDMFRLLDVQCDTSRIGVRYQRWDAYLSVHGSAIPIEIKSPAEEEFISTKALRQAVENKIVLLARKSIDINRDTTSLIVGYRPPKDRSDMSSLIDDVFNTYGIRIGVIDLHTLALAGLRSLCEGKKVDMKVIEQLKGFLRA